MKLMKFTLSAPLQSWGEDARWDYRATSAMPTKSASIGLLGCCLGIFRGDERLNRLDKLLRVAVRADQPGRVMTDYQTVHSLDETPLLTANGGHRKKGEGLETPKQYLQDARFTVFLWGDEETLNTCFQAMAHPKWAVYLGRKSCVPAVPVKPVWMEADTPEDAVARFTEEERQRCEAMAHVEMDALPNEELKAGQRMITRHDTLLRADRNEYTVRWVKAFAVQSGGENPCT